MTRMKITKCFEKHTVVYKELPEDVSDHLMTARAVIQRTYKLEAAFDNLISAYKGFKVEVHKENVERLTMGGKVDYIFNHESRANLNRHVSNVLNLSKYYLDANVYSKQTKSFVLNVTGDPELHNKVIAEYNREYDSNKEYVLGCALRNIAQHRVLPVNNLRSGYDASFSEGMLVSRFTLPLSKQEILGDPKVKSEWKGPLREYEGTPDVNVVLDGYIYAITSFHNLNRELSADVYLKAVKYFEQLAKAMRTEFESNEIAIDIVDVDENGNEERLFRLDMGWSEVIPHLRNKNYGLVDPSKVELSSRPR